MPGIAVCVAAPSAMKVPVVSTIVTRNAIDIAMMPEIGKLSPKCIGCGIAKIGALWT